MEPQEGVLRQMYEAEAAISAAISEIQTMHVGQEFVDEVSALKAKLSSNELTPSGVIVEAERIVENARTLSSSTEEQRA